MNITPTNLITNNTTFNGGVVVKGGGGRKLITAIENAPTFNHYAQKGFNVVVRTNPRIVCTDSGKSNMHPRKKALRKFETAYFLQISLLKENSIIERILDFFHLIKRHSYTEGVHREENTIKSLSDTKNAESLKRRIELWEKRKRKRI